MKCDSCGYKHKDIYVEYQLFFLIVDYHQTDRAQGHQHTGYGSYDIMTSLMHNLCTSTHVYTSTHVDTKPKGKKGKNSIHKDPIQPHAHDPIQENPHASAKPSKKAIQTSAQTNPIVKRLPIKLAPLDTNPIL
jgi:hypothetical protein